MIEAWASIPSGQEIDQGIGQEIDREIGQEIGGEIGLEIGQEMGQEIDQEIDPETGPDIGPEHRCRCGKRHSQPCLLRCLSLRVVAFVFGSPEL